MQTCDYFSDRPLDDALAEARAMPDDAIATEAEEYDFLDPSLRRPIKTLVWKILCCLSNPVITVNHRRYSRNGFFVKPFLNGKSAVDLDPCAVVAFCGWGFLLCLLRDDEGLMTSKTRRVWGRVEARTSNGHA